MKKKLFIATLIYLLNFLNIYPQTGKYWGDYSYSYVLGGFFSNTDFQPYPQYLWPQTFSGSDAVFTQSSFNGDLMFLGGSTRVFNGNGSALKNSDKLYIPPYSVGVQAGDNIWEAIGFHYFDTTILGNTGEGSFQKTKQLMANYCSYNNCFDSLKYYPFGFYKTELKRDTGNIGYVVDKMRYFNLPINRIQIFDIKRTYDYKYQLLGYRPMIPLKKNESNTIGLYHFSYQHNDCKILDSFVFNAYDYLPDSVKIYLPQTNIYLAWAKLSRNRDKIFINLKIETKYKILFEYNTEIFFEMDVDPATGKFISNPQQIYQNSFSNYQTFKLTENIFCYNVLGGSFPINDAFSPNDSILYMEYSERKVEKGVTKEINQNIIAWKFRAEPLKNAKPIFTKTEFNIGYPKWSIRPPNINPYGGLTAEFRYQNSTNDFLHFADANKPNASQFVIQNFPQKHQVIGTFQFPVLHNYDYLRIKDSIVYKDCGAYAFIKNKSDISNGISDFKWYVAKDIKWTQWDSFNTVDLPTQFFTKSGKYLFKMRGTSFKGSGYREWYIDTIIIKIPPKPIADFYAKDSIVCRYTGLQFENYCYSKDTITNNYLWSFGDGNTSSAKNPLYIYPKPGIYTVSLFYRNGYCDSTLVKNQYIKVVDAPRPGFNVLSLQGCAPFTAQFKDTVILNVKQKDYYFSDTKLWQNISITNPNFTHIFYKAGIYRAVQRLTGFTGCVIQTDSVIFNISKGLTIQDTIHIINSSVENKNAIVFWGSNEAAKKYQLFKDNNPYIQTDDTFFNETTVYTKDALYSVAGIDSCGNYSSIGRVGKPIFLQGNIIGNNESSIIFFTPYKQWQGIDINYGIQKLVKGVWMFINGQKNNANFMDKDFLTKGELEVCYRIEAFESAKPGLVSHSNELCIPYIPTLFVPTAFTPNDDAINDVYELTSFGISTYTLTIINRWGEIIFKGKENEPWNGNNASQGIYTILINYTTNTGSKLVQRVNVTLLR